MIRSAEEFVSLRVSEDPAEYGRAAAEEAPVDVWKDVIRSYPQMRGWVALNKRVPVEILAILADDPDPEIRWFVALKRKLTSDLFEKLSEDDDEGVRLRIAMNPKTPGHVLRKLASDGSTTVAEEARARSSAPRP